MNIGDNVERRARLAAHQSRLRSYALRVGDKIFVKLAIVDGELSASGSQKHASGARFATSCAVILNQISHSVFVSLWKLRSHCASESFKTYFPTASGSGFCAACVCLSSR